MSDWQTVPLASVLDFREGPGVMAIDFRAEGIPLIRLAGLKSGAPLLKGCNFLDPNKVETRWKQFRLEVGDVLLSTSASLGEVATVDESAKGAVPYTGIVAFRPKDARVAAEFIPFLLTQRSFKLQIEAMGVGSVMRHFGPSHLRKMSVTVPPIAHQRAIAEVLGALDHKIVSNAKLANTADQLCSALTKRALDSKVRRSLSSIAAITMGTSPIGSSLNEEGLGSVFYQGVRDFGVRFPSRRIWTTSPLRFAEVGDCLLSVRAPVGQVNLANELTCIGRGLASVRSLDGRRYTLLHLLKDSREIWAPFEAEGTIFGSINKSQLESIEIPGIVAARADQLEGDLSRLEGSIAAALNENHSLADARDALLAQLVSGKLRVQDAETVVEAMI